MNKTEYKHNLKETQKTFGSDCLNLGKKCTHLITKLPRNFLFKYSRYKFCAKMIGTDETLLILELGCGEALGTLLLIEEAIHNVTAVDIDRDAIEWNKNNLKNVTNIKFIYDDFLGKIYGKFDVVIMIDVIEHIPKEFETKLFLTIINNLSSDGFCIIGTPNITASEYQSIPSKVGHINLYDMGRLRKIMKTYFKNVFMFGMNDEVLHTGYAPMCNYLFAIGCGKKLHDQ